MLHATVLPDSALPPTFTCSRIDVGLDSARVHVSGELDLATAAQLERSLDEAQLQARLVVLDLRELAFIDSSGLHAILNASVRARQLGRRLVVLRGPPNVDRIFTLIGSSDELDFGDLSTIERAA